MHFQNFFLLTILRRVYFTFNYIYSSERCILFDQKRKGKKEKSTTITSIKLKKKKRGKKQHLSEKERSTIAQINSKPPIPSEQRWNEAADTSTNVRCIHFYIPRQHIKRDTDTAHKLLVLTLQGTSAKQWSICFHDQTDKRNDTQTYVNTVIPRIISRV